MSKNTEYTLEQITDALISSANCIFHYDRWIWHSKHKPEGLVSNTNSQPLQEKGNV
jgi:hypothetical protein